MTQIGTWQQFRLKGKGQRRICFICFRLEQLEIQMQTDNCSLESVSLADINV